MLSKTTRDLSTDAGAFMAKRLYTVGPDERVFHVVRELVRRKYSGCPVVEGNRLVGILSEKDCIHALTRAVVDQMPPAFVRDVMTTEVITITSDTPLLTVAHLFLDKNLRRVPVVDNDRLVGQVSRRDLLRHAISIFESHPDRESATLFLSAVTGTVPPTARRVRSS